MRGGRVREGKTRELAAFAASPSRRSHKAAGQDRALGQGGGKHAGPVLFARAASRAHVVHRAAFHHQPLFGAGDAKKERDAAVVRFGSLCHLLSVAASSLGEEARGAQQVLHHLHAAGA
jgi:hypothetical protein